MLTGSHSAFARGATIVDYLAGNLAGQRAVTDLQGGLLAPDHLYNLLKAESPILASEYARGLLRAVQKHIEQSPLRRVQGGCA